MRYTILSLIMLAFSVLPSAADATDDDDARDAYAKGARLFEAEAYEEALVFSVVPMKYPNANR